MVFLVNNLVGFGLGPLAVGALSDWLALGSGEAAALGEALFWVFPAFAPGRGPDADRGQTVAEERTGRLRRDDRPRRQLSLPMLHPIPTEPLIYSDGG